MQTSVLAEHSWMLFVDGENFTIRAQELAKSKDIQLIEGVYYKRDCFIWIPGLNARRPLGSSSPGLQRAPVRATYYTSLVGDHDCIDAVRDQLRALRFSPKVFKKAKREIKAKGVDISLTKDMLSHAFLGNYETAVLLAGDGDYVPLVEEVQRLGKRLIIWFFDDGSMSSELRRIADDFTDLSHTVLSNWKSMPNAGLVDY